MELSAIRHIADKRCCLSVGNNGFLFRIQTKKSDVSEIVLHTLDKYMKPEVKDTKQAHMMKKIATDRLCDYYETTVYFDYSIRCIRYYFEITGNDGEKVFIGSEYFSGNEITDIDRMYNCTCKLREEERIDVPDWAAGKVVYQIFPARYATTKHVPENVWYKAPIGDKTDLKGDLRGIINTLDHLKELGIDVLYLTPIFKSPSTHKYNTVDYYEISPDLGTKADLKELVEKCHEMGMKVILDGVFNHTATDFFAFQDVMKNGSSSRYYDWYYIEKYPINMGSGTKIPGYLTFAYYGGMPKLNMSNDETAEYFTNVGKYWIEECDIDGWRLDVGDEISHSFMKKFRKAIRSVKKDAFIVGEDWQHGRDYLDGDEWDSIMNYSFWRLVKDYVMDSSITASEAVEDIGHIRGMFPPQIFNVLWNLIDTHDTPRFLAMCGNDRKKQRFAAAMSLLLPGMPFIYYGDEYGIGGENDPDNRRGMLWDSKYQDEDTYSLYRRLIAIRKEYKDIAQGTITEYRTDNENNIIIYCCGEGDGKVTVIMHGKGDKATLEEFAGRSNLLSDKKFDGIMEEFSVAVIK